jgi:orotate phosphoribosyltransferase
MTEHQQLIDLLLARSVKRGAFTLASGQTSDIYIDVRLTSMSPEGLSTLGPLALGAIRNRGWRVDSVGGMTLGADPISYAISYASNFAPPLLRAFTVRKEAKVHGTGKQIEGPFRKQDSVVIIEDVITTGASALQAIDAVMKEGGKIAGVLAVVDREDGGKQRIAERGFDVISLATLSELRMR